VDCARGDPIREGPLGSPELYGSQCSAQAKFWATSTIGISNLMVGAIGRLRTPATMGAYEANPLSALLIYGYELSRNNSFAQFSAAKLFLFSILGTTGNRSP